MYYSLHINVKKSSFITPLLVSALIVLGGSSAYGAITVQEHSFTGADVSVLLPSDVTSLTFEVIGAQGASSGGVGHFLTGTLSLSPSSTLTFRVGGRGQNVALGFGGGGGGMSGIFVMGTGWQVIAGGGGGGGAQGNGGNAGANGSGPVPGAGGSNGAGGAGLSGNGGAGTLIDLGDGTGGASNDGGHGGFGGGAGSFGTSTPGSTFGGGGSASFNGELFGGGASSTTGNGGGGGGGGYGGGGGGHSSGGGGGGHLLGTDVTNGVLAHVTNQYFDPSTVNTNGDGYIKISYDTTVPEPSSGILLLSGGALLLFRRRARMRTDKL